MNVVWILVYIVIQGMEPVAINAMGPRVTFPDMVSCFQARESLSAQVGPGQGYFYPGTQAVCIPLQTTQS